MRNLIRSFSQKDSSLRLIIICGVLTAFPSMSIDMGLPGFADMAASFGVSVEHVSLTLSVFFFGFSASPLIYGPLSDRAGRRPVLLFVCFVYAIASIFATSTSSFGALLFWRLLQGTGAGAASVLAITVIRDYRQGPSARRLLSYAAVVRIIAPTTAPTLGNVLLLLGSWRWIYGFMAFGGVMMSVMVAIGLAESSRAKLAIVAARKALLADSRAISGSKEAALDAPSASVNEPLASSAAASSSAPASPARRSVLADYKMFLSDRLSVAYVLIAALTFSSHFSYVTGSLYVFVNVLHVSTTTYGFLFGGMALFLMLGSLISGQLSKHDVPGDLIIGVSLSVSALSAFVMLILASTHFLNVPILTALLSTNTLCLGLLTPSAQQGAMENAGEYAGTASALMNAIMTGMGACFSYAEGMLLVWLHEIPAVVMSGLMLICCGCGTAVFFKVIRPASLARRH